MSGRKWVYKFGGGSSEGNKSMKHLLGGKGANLGEMASLGLPVPPGFTISTETCKFFAEHGDLPPGLDAQIDEGIRTLEATMNAKFGDNCTEADTPLLVSVRSGAAISMPGMMDTVLNTGLNETTAAALMRKTGNPRFVWDSYRRFVDMFGDVCCGVSHELFEAEMAELKAARGVKEDIELEAADLEELVTRYKKVFEANYGQPFPERPRDQLRKAILAVFSSWSNPRAVAYRRINKITGLLGTAVNVQSMAYGNMGDTSGTGVLFTRNPATGEDTIYGEYLINAQGEDVVAGIRTPKPIHTLETAMPSVYKELADGVKLLERHMKNVQDCEFTIQEGRLFLLQTRDGKRTGRAAVKIASDMVQQGLVTEHEAVAKLVTVKHIDQLLHPMFNPEARAAAGKALAKGIAASPGAAVGQAVFTADEAEAWRAQGKRVILVRQDTSAEDVGGMHSAEGIVTSRGGMTSHAAVVARGWGKPCVAGCGDLQVDAEGKAFVAPDGSSIKEGDWLSVDGTTGEVLRGQIETQEPEVSGDFARFMQWVRSVHSALHVHANADTPEDVARAVELGAQGVGLVRTEHMFFGEDRIPAMRRMILAETEEERVDALERLYPIQKGDFASILRAAGGRPVTIRLLDPPLHEFMPREPAAVAQVAKMLGKDPAMVESRVRKMQETNPMLGHRGCRLGITHQSITQMQARAAVNAASEVQAEGTPVHLEIMVPLVTMATEIEHQRRLIEEVAQHVRQHPVLRIGTMIETPRAAITASEIAEHAEFFSFGTNDLTQTVFAFSRDDAETFLPNYIESGILKDDPFQTLDTEGVGELMRLAIENGRTVRPSLRVGLCGEQGGDERSVHFCYKIGCNYVSCSPFRVPVALLAAAQAHLQFKKL